MNEFYIDTWEDFLKYVDNNQFIKKQKNDYPETINLIDTEFNYSGALYRGHSKISYKLESTLERAIKKELPKGAKIKREFFDCIKADYLEKVKHFLKGRISEQSILLDDRFENEIWAVGQHFGLASPLLDWSRSFFVALYFAFHEKHYVDPEDKKDVEDCAYRVIYVLNILFYQQNIQTISTGIDIGGRITAQQGIFTNLLLSEMEEFGECKNFITDNPAVPNIYPYERILINSNLRSEIMSYLYSLNVHGSTIFPDVFGAIKDCHLELENIVELNSLN